MLCSRPHSLAEIVLLKGSDTVFFLMNNIFLLHVGDLAIRSSEVTRIDSFFQA